MGLRSRHGARRCARLSARTPRSAVSVRYGRPLRRRCVVAAAAATARSGFGIALAGLRKLGHRSSCLCRSACALLRWTSLPPPSLPPGSSCPRLLPRTHLPASSFHAQNPQWRAASLYAYARSAPRDARLTDTRVLYTMCPPSCPRLLAPTPLGALLLHRRRSPPCTADSGLGGPRSRTYFGLRVPGRRGADVRWTRPWVTTRRGSAAEEGKG
eukprot:291713-Chlamydomonas_euryale.AAC.9